MFFWKINSAGNDFIIINNIKEKIHEAKFPAMARKLCERHLSIGGDGLIAIEKPTDSSADITMRIFNPDGSEAEMCGNGLRCIARCAWEEKLAGDLIRVHTIAGYAEVERLSPREYKIKLQKPSNLKPEAVVSVNGREYLCIYVEVGNPGAPHIVVPVKRLNEIGRDILFVDGRSLRYHHSFPKGVNVNFCEVIDENTVDLLTYERGVEDFTYACGTGSGSTALILRLLNMVKSDTVTVKVPGGVFKAELIKENNASVNVEDIEIRLTGDTNIVFRGEAADEDFVL